MSMSSSIGDTRSDDATSLSRAEALLRSLRFLLLIISSVDELPLLHNSLLAQLPF
jgi:hypothetical protein